ncbi:PEGA domain protein [Lacunisphaera limnophila]|uniref:PEGA domain protein n=1 Tax=Lacunisphaera limnophila TaxID=1838286 RepID=A0A1D8AY32_9BACT|nr:PEGA domain-containing protein [Lacunisphaera limnophila]AOS45791.1 PEGA domain protein [Lacunisphaera limnophila]
MSPTEAAKLLDLPEHATPDQLEARFQELRTKLEEKIGKAPTPGLKAKYRESLDEITLAFETLTLAADSSSLPVLQREQQRTEGRGQTTEGIRTHPDPAGLPSPKKPKSGGKEFALVAVIAVAVLGAGGWFVLKIRAENAEKARQVAAAQAEAERKAVIERAEAERKAEAEHLATAARQQAEEAEKTRLAAAAKAEQERVDRLAAQLRSQLAEAKVAWEIAEREERNAERRLSELKSELRGLRDASPGQLAEAQALVLAQQDFYDWLSNTLARHPVRFARSKVEELVSARQYDEALPLVAEIMEAMPLLDAEIRQQRVALLSTSGSVEVRSIPSGLAWSLEDAFGRRRSGLTPSEVPEAAIGQAKLTVSRPGWPDWTQAVHVRRGRLVTEATFRAGTLKLVANVPGAQVEVQGRSLGNTPLEVAELPVGPTEFTVSAPKYTAQVVKGEITENQVLELSVKLEPEILTAEQLVAAFWDKAEGTWLPIDAPAKGRFAALYQAPIVFQKANYGLTVFGQPCVVDTVDPTLLALRLRSQAALGVALVERNGKLVRELAYARYNVQLQNDRLTLTFEGGQPINYLRK